MEARRSGNRGDDERDSPKGIEDRSDIANFVAARMLSNASMMLMTLALANSI
jgi:hypothetical protein